MRIRKVSKESTTNLDIADKDSKQALNRTQQSFGEQLQRIQSSFIHQKLESLFNDLDKQGRVLGETLNIKDLKKYKGLIQKFLDYAVNKMYRLNEQSGWDRKGRYKTLTIVETINKELENLTGMILAEQKDRILILAKLDEIRGLLIDLYS